MSVLKDQYCMIISIFLCFLFLPAASFGECDCPKAEEKKSPWDKSVSLGFNLTRGNSKNLLLTGELRLDYADQSNPHELHFQVNGSEGKTEDTETGVEDVTQREILGEARYRYLLNDRIYAAMGISAEYDEVADIDYRVSLDPALGFYAIKEEMIRLAFEAGPSHVFEEVGEIKNNYWAYRVAERFEWDLSESSKVFQSAVATLSAEDEDDSLFDMEAGVEAFLTNTLALTLRAKDMYDNLPAAGKKRNDFSLVSGLKYIW